MMEKTDRTDENLARIDQPAGGQRPWIKPFITAIEVSETETGGSNFTNLDGGSSCAS